MTIGELHDYCRSALSRIMFKCHSGLSDEDRQRIADWRESHWKDTK